MSINFRWTLIGPQKASANQWAPADDSHEPNPPLSLEEENKPQEDGFHWDSDDTGLNVISDGGYQQSDEPARQTEDAWDWGGEFVADEVMEIEATTQPQPETAAAAPPVDQVDDFTAQDDYEDPTVDLVEASVGPVQPNAPPPPDLPADDPWPWIDEVTDDLLLDDVQLEDAAAPLAGLTPDDQWPWDDFTSEDLLDDQAIGPDAPPSSADIAPQDEIDWNEDGWAPTAFPDGGYQQADPVSSADSPVDDPWSWIEEVTDELLFDDQTIGADAPPASSDIAPSDEPDFGIEVEDDFFDDFGNEHEDPLPPEDAWDWTTELASDDFDDQSLNENAAAPLPSLALDDPWPWDDPADDWELQGIVDDDDDPVGPDAPALPEDAWPWQTEPVEDERPADDPIPPDAVADQPPADPWEFAEEIADEVPEDSGPVTPDVVQPDQPAEDPWPLDEITDEWQDESGPVGADQTAEQPQDDPFWAQEDAQGDDWRPTDDQPPDADPPPEDAPLFESELDDSLLLDDFLNEDEPPIATADAWNWDEEPNDGDDAWWQVLEHPLVDLVLLAGPTYAEAWDWNGEDTEDDDWWRDLPQPDPAGLPLDTCPAELAAALARIAELEALLAAALAKPAMASGGGGDDYDYTVRRYLDAGSDAKRARIDANNRLIMALVGAVVHGFEWPEGPT